MPEAIETYKGVGIYYLWEEHRYKFNTELDLERTHDSIDEAKEFIDSVQDVATPFEGIDGVNNSRKNILRIISNDSLTADDRFQLQAEIDIFLKCAVEAEKRIIWDTLPEDAEMAVCPCCGSKFLYGNSSIVFRSKEPESESYIMCPACGTDVKLPKYEDNKGDK